MRCFRKLLLVLLLLMLAVGTGLYYVADWLLIEQKPVSSDFAVILAGDYRRALYAADLYNQGVVGKIYISRPVRTEHEQTLDRMNVPFPRQEEINWQLLEKKKVPSEAILLFGNGSVSTVEEAHELAKITKGQPEASFLIVTSPYHVRRAYMIFSNVLQQDKFRVIANRYEPFLRQWWRDQTSARNVLLELPKILFYIFGGSYFSAAGRA